MRFRDTLNIDFCDYNPFHPTEEQALGVSIYSLTSALFFDFLKPRPKGGQGAAMEKELIDKRKRFKELWISPQMFVKLIDADPAHIQKSLEVYCEDWLDLKELESRKEYARIESAIYIQNSLFAKIFIRPIHYSQMRDVLLDCILAVPGQAGNYEAAIQPTDMESLFSANLN